MEYFHELIFSNGSMFLDDKELHGVKSFQIKNEASGYGTSLSIDLIVDFNVGKSHEPKNKQKNTR